MVKESPEGDPVSNRPLNPLLKTKGGNKCLGFSPSPHPMESLMEMLKFGGLQANQALREWFEDLQFEGPREVVSGEDGLTVDAEKEGEAVLEIASPQRASFLEIPRQEVYQADPNLLNRFEISTHTVDLPSSLSVFGRPLFQGGSSGMGGLNVMGKEEGFIAFGDCGGE